MPSKRRAGSSLPRRRNQSSAPPVATQQSKSRLIAVVAGLAVVVTVGLILAGSLVRRGGNDTAAIAASNVPVTERTKGDLNAPVTIVEYADLQCPVCARFSQTIEPQLVEKYVATGIAKIEYRYFAFLGRESQRAAEACECAGEQGQFFPYRDALYANQRGENRGAFSDDNLRRIASSVGLDTDAFNACLQSGRGAETVTAQTAEGKALGVQATPTFFINGSKLEGLAPLATYEQLIEQAARTATGQQP
jgi:protein-disulfide isomerase